MTLLFSFPEQAALGETLGGNAGYEKGDWTWRRFPDGESYVRVLSEVRGQQARILCSLNHPDEKTMALIFLARTLKELGCEKVTLIAPYLGYMRQDKRFNEGEAITSAIFAKQLSKHIDALVTIDPHLHRYRRLEEIYDCECACASASPLIAQWIADHTPQPFIIGPDSESEQWVREVAGQVDAPYVILNKIRHGDRDVEISLPDILDYKGRVPVLVDDMISTAGTMMKTIQLLRRQGYEQVVCLATHAVFAENAYEELLKGGGVRVVTCNTITHVSNGMDVGALL